tara:strand:+ start:3088 stop:5523 length:2436 start_codon:yes stop_codon:yes gene_type:complete
MAKPPISLMDRNVPAQLDPQDLEAEIELELPGSLEPREIGEIEVEMEEDGGAVIDFDPTATAAESAPQDFFGNLAENIDDQQLSTLAGELVAEYEANKSGRQEWEDAFANGLELLGFNYSERSEPFNGATGVTHPLLAEAAVQFQAQAFNELLPAGGPVRTSIVGATTRETEDQSQRVKDFMNHYITNVMEEYTPEFDQMLFYLPLAGSTFKKVYYDGALDRAVSKFVPAENLIVPYEANDLETCPNITHTVKINLNELRKQQISGFYLDIPVLPQQGNSSSLTQEINELSGMEPSQIDYDCTLLECHADLDLEGYEDMGKDGEPTGIKIPYIVTISQDNGQVLSIRRNYAEADPQKKKIQYFVHYKFLPGFGFYGLGLIHTIGGLSRTATAALRQLIDAGTLSNLPAGFKARGLRIRDDEEPLQPGEFRDVDAPGGAIRDSLMPLPFKGPDQTLFQLLGFVVQAGQRFATITDLKVGDGNQQAAVGTTIAMMEQGSRVMSAVHKRLHYAMRVEFKLLSKVMADSLPPEYPYAIEGAEATIKAQDFDDRVDIIPVSNPNVFSQSQRIALAQTQMQLAAQAPEMHNMYEVYRDMYEALGVRNIDKYLNPPVSQEPAPKDPAQENMDVLDQAPLVAFQGQNHQAHIMAHLVFGGSPTVSGTPPVAVALQKHVMEHVKIQAQERAMAEVTEKRGAQAQEGPSQEEILTMESLTAQYVAEGLQQVQQLSQQLSGAGAPDPVVELKQQELQLRAQKDQADIEREQAELQLRSKQINQSGDISRERIQSQENMTGDRIDAAREREILKQQAKQRSGQ